MNDVSIIILVWLAFGAGAIAGAVMAWSMADRRERAHDKAEDKAERIRKDFFKGLR